MNWVVPNWKVFVVTVFSFAAGANGAEIAFFVNNPDALTFGDDTMFLLLEDMGHSVTAHSHNELAGDQLSIANAADLSIVSESVTSGSIGANLNPTSKPMIVYEPFVFDDMGFTGPTSTTTGLGEFDFGFSAPEETDLEIVNATHPLAAGLAEGTVTVYDSPAIVTWGFPTEDADIIARPAGPDGVESAAIFVYEPGDELWDGSLAAGLRIGFFLHDRTSEVALLTDEGLDLVRAAVSYSLGGTAVIPGDFDGDQLLTASDIDLLSAEVRAGTNQAKFDVTEDGLVDTADRDRWVEGLKKTYYGDSDLDGVFGSTDFIKVFLAGEYEDGIANNSAWATGDWNGDTEFDTKDFIASFLGGGYNEPPRMAVKAVPEPSSMLLLLLGMASVGRLVRRRSTQCCVTAKD